MYFPGLFFGGLHMYHVSSLYENDRSFSLLSTMEREMSFRTEMVIFPSFFAARKQQSWLRCYLDKWLPLNFPLSKKKGWSGSSHFLEVEDPKKERILGKVHPPCLFFGLSENSTRMHCRKVKSDVI